MAMGFGGGAAGDSDVAMISGNVDGKELKGAWRCFLGEEQWRKVIMAKAERGGLGGWGC